MEESLQNRFSKTKEATIRNYKWAKDGVNKSKLFIYAKAGRIEESEHCAQVKQALLTLDTFQTTIDPLLANAEKWSQSMLQCMTNQKNLIYALNQSAASMNIQQKQGRFAQIIKGISSELTINEKECKLRHNQTLKLLVAPLQNILNHEIKHALSLKKKYIQNKRQFDDICTSISNLKQRIEETNELKQGDNGSANGSAFGKLKVGFGKLMPSSIGSKEDLEGKLQEMRGALTQHIKVFDMAKEQLLEYVDIVEEKLNVEIVFYVKKFYEFVKKWKDANSACMGDDIDDDDDAVEENEDFDGFKGYDKIPNQEDSDVNGAWFGDEWNEKQCLQ